jgi:hypothetical protein
MPAHLARAGRNDHLQTIAVVVDSPARFGSDPAFGRARLLFVSNPLSMNRAFNTHQSYAFTFIF